MSNLGLLAIAVSIISLAGIGLAGMVHSLHKRVEWLEQRNRG